jgi:hypothetical protein
MSHEIPIEIINKILLYRTPHPNSIIIKTFINDLYDVQCRLKGNNFTFYKLLQYNTLFKHKEFIDYSFVKKYNVCWNFFKFFKTEKQYLCFNTYKSTSLFN